VIVGRKRAHFRSYVLVGDGDRDLTAWMAQNVELAIWEKPDIPPDCDVVTLKVRNISPDDGALLHEVEPVITMPHKPSDTKQPNWSTDP
jgi:hypothetical protein